MSEVPAPVEAVQEEAYVSPEVDYDELPSIYGRYEYVYTPSNEQYSNIVPTSGLKMTYNILSTQCVNLGESYWEAELSIDAQGANTNLWMLAGCIPLFRTLTLFPGSGNQQVIDQFHHWSKITLAYLTALQETKQNDSSAIFFPSRVLQSQNKLPANGFNAANPYEDPMMVIPLDNGTANSDCTFLIRIPLSLFKGTLLAENRDHMFGQDVRIQFTLEDPSKWIYFNTNSPNDPSGGVPTALATKTNFKLQNPWLQLAIEVDEQAAARCAAMAARGYRCYVPSVWNQNQITLSGTSQNITAVSINRSMGAKLQRIWAAPFAQTEDVNTSLDNCNQAASPVTTVATNRVITYQTFWNGHARQQQLIYASPMVQSRAATSYDETAQGGQGDWNRLKYFMNGSNVLSSGALGLNFFICDDFTSPQGRLKKFMSEGRRIEGLDLFDAINNTWIMKANCSGTNNWYVYIEALRLMEVMPGRLTFF